MTRKCSLLFFFLLVYAASCFPSDLTIVAYKANDINQKEAYDRVIQGIKTVLNVEVIDLNNTDVENAIVLRKGSPKRIITLGKAAADIIYKTSYKNLVTAGMVYFENEYSNGVSVSFDGDEVIRHLKVILPKVNKFYIIQSSDFSTLSFSSGQSSKDPAIKIRSSHDSIELVRLTSNIIEKEADPNNSIVFMPANIPNDILYDLIRIAWDRKLIIISTNLWHLENGAMIVVYQDNYEQGKSLGNYVLNDLRGVKHTKSFKLALNKLIANHLSFDLSEKNKSFFSLTIK